jgi:hypothetical protein
VTDWARPDWWDFAVCRGRHDLVESFVPPAGIDRGQNRRGIHQMVSPELAHMCNVCPVADICYAEGQHDRYAIRGGTTAQHRETERRREKRLHVRSI